MRAGHLRLFLVFATVIFLFAGFNAVHAADGYRLLQIGGSPVRWVADRGETLPVIKYAFVNEANIDPAARNCASMGRLKLHSSSTPIEQPEVERIFRAAADQWQKHAKIHFKRVLDVANADLLIGGQTKPRGKAFADVQTIGQSYAKSGNIDLGPLRKTTSTMFKNAANGLMEFQPIAKSRICLNPQSAWKTGYDGNTEIFDLHYTFLHELGHVLGLNHTGYGGSVMGFGYSETFRTLQPADIAAVQFLYGERGEVITAQMTGRERPY